MVPAWYIIASLLGAFALICTVFLLVLYRISRKAAGPLDAEKRPIPVVPSNTLVDPDVIRVLSERLAMLEGRIPALQATVDGYTALSLRVTEMEGRLPTIVDAHDRFAQALVNANKRTAEREKRGKNRSQTVAEAAEQMGMAAATTAVPPPANGGTKPVGVMGTGGSTRR